MNSSIRTAAFIIWTKINRRWGQSASSYCIIRTSIIQAVTEHVGPTSYIVHLKTMKKVRMNLCSYLSSFVRYSGFSGLIFCYLITFAEDVQRDHLTFQGESVDLRLVPESVENLLPFSEPWYFYIFYKHRLGRLGSVF